MKKKVFVLILLCALVAFMTVGCELFTKKGETNGNEVPADAPEQKTIVYLGDSIAEAVLGPSPLSERDSYSYYAIIGQINDFHYINRAISGAETDDFLRAVKSEDEEFGGEKAAARRYWIREADVMVVSMLGNDLLASGMSRWAINTAINYSKGVEELDPAYTAVLEEAKNNVFETIREIRLLNKDAPIIWQTLYNPMTEESVLFSDYYRKQFAKKVAEGSIDSEYSLRDIADFLIVALNRVVYEAKEEFPDNFYIADVYGDFKKIFDENSEKGERLFYPDGVHPSNYGHAVITESVQKVLQEIGLTKEDSLQRYKTLVNDRLGRLYAETSVDTVAVKKSVDAAANMEEVRERYFDSTYAVTPELTPNVMPYRSGKTFDEGKFFMLESAMIEGNEISSVDPSELLDGVIDKDKLKTLFPQKIDLLDKYETGFLFEEDGTFSIALTVNPSVISLVNTVFNLAGDKIDVDIDALLTEPTVDVTPLDKYLNALFPGFTIKDVIGAYRLLNSCGVEIEGVDADSDAFRAFCDAVSNEGTLPDKLKLPETLTLKLNGYYTVETIDEDKPYEVVYLRLVSTNENSVPLFCCRLVDLNDEYGTQKLIFTVEFAHFEVTCLY